MLISIQRLLLLLVMASSAVFLGASGASADVLINQPAAHVCKGEHFEVGVWYQAYSGGSRHYRVRVYDPSGSKIFDEAGRASERKWRIWKIWTAHRGVYRTVYSFSSGVAPYATRTRSLAC